MGISLEGKSTEDRFEYLTGAAKCEKRADGDHYFPGIVGSIIEEKTANGGTINQVRASKYAVLVLNCKEEWWVIPANIVVQLVVDRRGQHQPNPFIVANLQMAQVSANYKVSENGLRQKVLEAIEEGKRYPELKTAMNKINEDIEALATTHKNRVKNILQSLTKTGSQKEKLYPS